MRYLNKPTIAELEAILEQGDQEICILPNGEVSTTESRFTQYRELLETWMKWWYGPAKDYGLHNQLPVIPPVTDTLEALKCLACSGVVDNDHGRCAVCGRDLTLPAGG